MPFPSAARPLAAPLGASLALPVSAHAREQKPAALPAPGPEKGNWVTLKAGVDGSRLSSRGNSFVGTYLGMFARSGQR